MMVGAALLVSSTIAEAQSRCPAGGSGCNLDNAAVRIQQRVNEGARKVWENSNPQGRVKEVGQTLRDCVRCGMDAVQEGMNRITTPNTSDSSSTSDSTGPESSPDISTIPD